MQTQLLDPLGTICKLVSLNFSKESTKISIKNHVLNVQQPSGYQCIVRMYNGDDRENISELYYVIIRVLSWYVIKPGDNGLQCSESLRKILKYLCKGLKRLQETYKYGNVVLSIQFYINIINDALNGNFSKRKLPKYILNKNQEYKNLLDYEKIKNLWSDKKLSEVCELYDKCFEVAKDENKTRNEKNLFINSYLSSIYLILKANDEDFLELIDNSNNG